MLESFRKLGCRVDLVTGYSSERKHRIKMIKNNIKDGIKYDFLYAESSTMPTLLTDRHHLPLHPFMDWFFFRFCKKNDIPIGLFYRDIYWLFDGYGSGINIVKRAVAKAAYRFDLWVYRQTLSKLYLPSLEMGQYVPMVNPECFESLPPGHSVPEVTAMTDLDQPKKNIKLFYVGGMSNHYQLHTLFEVASRTPRIQLTLCTRESEWLAVKHEYPEPGGNVRVVHSSGAGMEAELKDCDVAILYVKPQEYREFASPVKLYEYLGHQKPILASEGTLAGRFIKENDIGWALPYDGKALSDFFSKLINDPSIMYSAHQNLKALAHKHSWKSRVEQVIKGL